VVRNSASLKGNKLLRKLKILMKIKECNNFKENLKVSKKKKMNSKGQDLPELKGIFLKWRTIQNPKLLLFNK
jgi:hypothetical protein